MEPNFDFESFRIEYGSLPKKRTIAGGAQGTVIESELQGQNVAVKVMPGVADWHRIATALQMKHECIVATLRFCEIPYCLVMELCKCSLYNRIHSNKQITSDEFRNWSIQIATGMAYLHANGISHRDLKSQNILLTINDSVKVCDFDQSKVIDTSSMKMLTAEVGTLLWRAPEILRHEEYTKLVDVWSFGVVVWELVTQRMPYDYDKIDPARLLRLILLIGEGTLRLKVPTGVGQRLRILMMSCMNLNAKKRPKFDNILEVFKNIAIDKEIWDCMKPCWETIKYDYSYKAEKQKNFDDARAIADKKAGRIRQYFEEFLRKGRNLVENEKCEVRELTEAIRTHNNFMEKFAIKNFVENEPLIKNLRSTIEEGKILLNELLERKNQIIAKNSFSAAVASYILISLTNQIKNLNVTSSLLSLFITIGNNINPVDENALIQGTDLLFILLQQDTIDSRVCEQAFEIIAKAIGTTNEKLTQNCCDLLKLPEMEVEILNRKVPTAEILLETLKRHLGDKNIATSSISVLRNLIYEMNEDEINKINDKGLIELILKYLNENGSFTIADSELVFDCWRILSNATNTINAKDAERFVKADGFPCFRRYQRQFFDDVDILWCMVSMIRRISCHPSLRNHFFNDDSIPLLISLLDVHVDCVYLSYQTAWTLAGLFNEKDSLCSKAGINELEIERKITQTILSWDILADLRVGGNSFSTLIARLSQSENLLYQLLGVWTLANLILTKSAKYCPFLIKEGGLLPLQQLLDDVKTNENVRFYARTACEKLKKWQQISINK